MKLLIASLTTAAALSFGTTAHADVSAAARAFSDGQAAQLEGNYERAAQSFELAFHIAPAREALRSAVRARQLANQLPRAATLAHLLLAQYADDAVSAKLANDVLAEARTRLARIAVTCAPACTLAVGGRAISLDAAPSHVVFTSPGHQVLEVTFAGNRSVTREVTLTAGDELTLPIEPPPPPVSRPAAAPPAPRPVAEARAERGLPPAFAIAGGVATLALASITVWSGLDTNDAHDAYVAAPTHEAFTAGQAKQLRTNILLGSSIAAGVGTSVIAVFWTRWRGSPRPPADVAIRPTNGGVTLSLGGSF